MQRRFETRGEHFYFDFILNDVFYYNTSVDVEIDAYPVIDIDQLWLNILSDIPSSFSIQLFDTYPLPVDSIESLNLIGAHYFTNFDKIDEDIFSKEKDVLFFYQTGFILRGIRIKRLGKTGEQDCMVRLKFLCRKTQ